MGFTFYRDVFGSWRWEFRDDNGYFRDSQHGYERREDCVDAANKAGLTASSCSAGLSSRDAAILCVHPDPELRESLQQALAGYQTSLASTSLEAIRLANSSVFDAYVIDYWLPGSSGIHFCRHIRRTDPHTPVCFYTTVGAEEQRKRAFNAGASAYICTSAGPETLCDELRNLLELTESRSTRAKKDEERAIHEELERRVVVAIARTEEARALAAEATQRAARARAYDEFIDAGGTRAHFERWWPEMFAAAAASHHAPSAQGQTASGTS